MPHATVTPAIETVLRAARVEGNKLFLQGQLDKKLYAAVNKVLVNAGGKWSRSEQAHVFTKDPIIVLGLSTGDVMRDAKKDNQAFYTPADLARRVVQLASVSGKTVLEPSCGQGAIVSALLEAGAARVRAVDSDNKALQVMTEQGFAQTRRVVIALHDFLSLDPEDSGIGEPFDRVVANFPFAKNADVKHCAHAWKFLKPGGRLVAIMWPNTSRPRFQALLKADDVQSYEIIPVEAGAFKESGTDTATIILVLDKKS